MDYLNHARSELVKLRTLEADHVQLIISRMAMVLTDWGNEKPSALIAGYMSTLFKGEPLTPLTGEDDEWVWLKDEGVYGNIRCARVFKKKNGEAWDIEGIVFRQTDGSFIYGAGSHTVITFPYMPFTDIRDISEQDDIISENMHRSRYRPTMVEQKPVMIDHKGVQLGDDTLDMKPVHDPHSYPTLDNLLEDQTELGEVDGNEK